jgi:hypothetical protein
LFFWFLRPLREIALFEQADRPESAPITTYNGTRGNVPLYEFAIQTDGGASSYFISCPNIRVAFVVAQRLAASNPVKVFESGAQVGEVGRSPPNMIGMLSRRPFRHDV